MSEKPKFFHELSYPSSKFATFGRANDIGESVFYGAIGKAAPFAETNAKVGDYVAMSRWETTEKITLNHVGFSASVQSSLNSTRELSKLYQFVESTASENDLNEFVYNWLAFKFSQPAGQKIEIYKLTNAIKQKLSSPEFDGIMYPSIALMGNTDNIVLTTKAADEKLKFISVEYVHIKSIAGSNVEIQKIDTATEVDQSSIINWTGRDFEHKSDRSFNGKAIGNSWDFTDDQGVRIQPTSTGTVLASLTPLKTEFFREKDKLIQISKPLGKPQDNFMDDVVVGNQYDITENKYSITLYIPTSIYATQIIYKITSEISEYTPLETGYEIQLTEEHTEAIIFNSKDSEYDGKIIVYSEQSVNENILVEKAPKSLQLLFIYGAPTIH